MRRATFGAAGTPTCDVRPAPPAVQSLAGSDEEEGDHTPLQGLKGGDSVSSSVLFEVRLEVFTRSGGRRPATRGGEEPELWKCHENYEQK